MKQTILKYGLISGAISAGLMLAMFFISAPKAGEKFNFDNAAVYGYTSILLAMAVIFLGIKAYRDTVKMGTISIGQGFLLGLGISLISSICYSLMWLVVYYNFMPNFMDDYIFYSINKMKASGATEAALAAAQKEFSEYKEVYKSPFSIFLFTLIEPFPVGVLVSIVSALILRKK